MSDFSEQSGSGNESTSQAGDVVTFPGGLSGLNVPIRTKNRFSGLLIIAFTCVSAVGAGAVLWLIIQDISRKQWAEGADPWGGRGKILQELWLGSGGGGDDSLSGTPELSTPPSRAGHVSELSSLVSSAATFTQRLRGYIHPPMDGGYRFWIASSDGSELWLSADDTDVSKIRVASCPSEVGVGNWEKFPEQASQEILLKAGQRYYIEVLHKEGSGSRGSDNHCRVAWSGPSVVRAVVKGKYLSPLDSK